jgi:galactokinase
MGGGIPTRICLAGEDLDWIGGRCVCVAIQLRTTVRLGPSSAAYTGPYLDAVWSRLTGGDGRPAPTVTVSTEAPTGSGLSTSTSLVLALSVACARASGRAAFRPDELIRFAYEVERDITNGGGMDHVAIVRGGVTYVDGRRDGPPELLGQLSWPAGLAVLIIDSRLRKESGTHLRETRERVARSEPRVAEYVRVAAAAAEEVWSALCHDDYPGLYVAINAAHNAMRDHQNMSNARLDALRADALAAGCPAVKLTGSGQGGCLFAIVPAGDAEPFTMELTRAYAAVEPLPRIIRADATRPGRPGWI